MNAQDINEKARKIVSDRKARVALSLRQSFDLIDYIRNNPAQEGETYADIAKRANVALNIDFINRDHVDERFRQMGWVLVEAKTRQAPEAARIVELEVKLARLSDLMYRYMSGEAPAILLATLVDEFGAGQY